VSLRAALSKNTFVIAIAVCLAAGRIGATLFVPPVIGLADNGDFVRVMARVGLGYTSDRYEERYWGWALTEFPIFDTSPLRTAHITSEAPLAGLAVLATRLVSRRPVLDIRMLGALHALLFLCGIALLIRSCRDLAPASQWLVAGLLVFFFTDVGYTAPFHSLYGQTASLLSLLLVLGVAGLAVRRGGISLWQVCAYFLCAAWFVASKPQECLQAPLLAVFGILLASGPPSQRLARRLAMMLALALCAFAVWLYSRVPRFEIHDVGVYHSVFMDLLPNSPDPVGDLRELDLDPEMVKYSGQHAYSAESPLGNSRFRAQFFERFGYTNLLGFYGKHPTRLLDRLRRAGRLAFQLRPGNLGNFNQASGARFKSLYMHAGTWSRWRLKLGRGGLVWIVLLFAASLVGTVRGWKTSNWQSRLFRSGMLLLVFMGTLEFTVCSLADYLGDLPRHLYVFQAIFDLILVADAAWLAQILVSRIRSRRGALIPVSA
jgi:hypothetical protein